MPVTPRNQLPLPMELRPDRPARLSQTWLQHYQRCKHSAFLYLKYRGATTSPQMERGSLAHEVIATLTNDALGSGEVVIPHELAKAALFELYASGEFTVPATEWDHVRRCVYNWAASTEAQPDQRTFSGPLPLDKILGVEQLVVMRVGDWAVSGKIDLIWRDGVTVVVRDFKTSPSALTQEQFDQSFQQKVYSLLAAHGQPVTVTICGDCNGNGWRYYAEGAPASEAPRQRVECVECSGKGYFETLEPYPLGEGAQHFDIAEVYPALAFEEGGLMQRQRTMSRAELLDERSMLEALLEQVSKSFDSGEWPAVPSDDACEKCACRRDCPLPDQLLPFTAIETPEEAEHFALASDVLAREKADVDKGLKAWVKNGGKIKRGEHHISGGGGPRPIPLGNGMQLNFVPVEVNETDYKGFREAQAQGKVVSLEDFAGKRIQTSFKAEPIPERDQSADEKWGETAPWDESDLSEGQAA